MAQERKADTGAPVIVKPEDVALRAAERDRDENATEYAMDDLDQPEDDLSDLDEVEEALATDAPSMTQAEAKYVPLWANAATQCRACTMFRTEGRCTLVKGEIRARGHCEHFDAKGGNDDKPTPEEARRQAIITAGGKVDDRAGQRNRRRQ